MAKIRAANLEPRSGHGDETLSAEQLVKLAVFAGLPPKRIETYPGAVVLRRFEPGEVICRQGDPGWTAFYILTGDELKKLRERPPSEDAAAPAPAVPPDGGATMQAKARVFVYQPESKGDEGAGRVLFRWLSRGRRPRHGAGTRKQVAALYEGELFGEMSCLNRAPRTATVEAAETVYMIEMLRNVLQIVQDNKANKAFRERLDQVYRQRALQSHLYGFPLLEGVSEDVLARLRESVELIEKKPGDIIFNQGDVSDSLYLISIGQVKVVRRSAGGERVLSYRSRGDVIGELGLVRGVTRSATCIAYEHPLREGHRKPKPPGRIELLRINNEVFTWLTTAAPVIRERLECLAESYLRPGPPVEEDLGMLALSARYHELGLAQGQKLMLIDLDRCTRCDECVRACAATHADGRTRLLREGPRFGRFLVPASCRQCRDAVCLLGCPVASIHKGPSGHIVIEDWCIGCKTCAEQCPYDAINMHELTELPSTAAKSTKAAGGEGGAPGEAKKADTRDLAVVCDQCSSLADGVPSCVYACPHDAAVRIDALQFFAARVAVAPSRQESGDAH